MLRKIRKWKEEKKAGIVGGSFEENKDIEKKWRLDHLLRFGIAALMALIFGFFLTQCSFNQ